MGILASDNYIDELLEELDYQMQMLTPGTTQVSVEYPVAALSPVDANYRRGVCNLVWLTPIRGDIYHAARELARCLQHPTNEDLARQKYFLRYLRGTRHYAHVLVLRMQLHAEAVAQLHVHVGSDWAGCRTTRKSTSDCAVVLLGCTIHQYVRTQGCIATSSREAEL